MRTSAEETLRRIRWVRVGVVAGLGLLALFHALPLLAWHGLLAPRLRAHPDGARLRVETVERFPAPPAAWARLGHGNLRIQAPPGAAIPESCLGGAVGPCWIRLEQGTLTLFGADYLESYREIVNLRAPDERDLSLLRPAAANWETIRALRDRVTTRRARLEAWRFRSTRAKGIVARHDLAGVTRYIVAAYSLDGARSRGLGVSGLGRDDLLRLLGSLELADAVAAPTAEEAATGEETP